TGAQPPMLTPAMPPPLVPSASAPGSPQPETAGPICQLGPSVQPALLLEKSSVNSVAADAPLTAARTRKVCVRRRFRMSILGSTMCATRNSLSGRILRVQLDALRRYWSDRAESKVFQDAEEVVVLPRWDGLR